MGDSPYVDDPLPAYMLTTTYYFRSRDPSSPSSPYVINSTAVDSYGSKQTMWRVETCSKGKKTRVIRADGTKLAKFYWERAPPTVKIGGKEMKCSEWAPSLPDKS